MNATPGPSDALPFAAPCRRLPPGQPIKWLVRGWADLRRAPRVSLCFGCAALLLSHLITFLAWRFGNLGLYLGLVSGFVFVGPVLALTWYSVSRRLERHRPVSLGGSLRDAARALGNALVFAIILTVVFLVWARAATMIYVFFPGLNNPSFRDLLPFLAIGSTVGAVFCAIIFAASAFSLPMLMDRRTDTVTAVVTSINAVLRNKPAMAAWAGLIAASVLIGLLTAWLALVVLLPLIGHATWHAYRDTIEAGQWPLIETIDPDP